MVLMEILEKAKGFLSEPSNAFESSKYDRIEDALKYYVIVSAIFSALLALMIALMSSIAGPALSAYLNIPGAGLADILSNFSMLPRLWHYLAGYLLAGYGHGYFRSWG
ncbi:MAG: hypothetical protein O8C60_01085 [Candidatus Methanoperedens sp.]|nr:hypothetical protein [Candidatus Methanoperedens sp.]